MLLRDLSKKELDHLLRKRLEKELPGVEGQYLMAPSERRSLPMDRPDARQAGVLCLIYPNREKWSVLLMKRKSYPGVHSDQISFPGGQVEDVDRDLLDTALRETEEEMGITIRSTDILAALTKLYIPPSNFMVHPFLGLIDHRPPINPRDEEVDEVIEADLQLFIDGSIQGRKYIKTSYGEYEVPVYEYNGYTIWGATAMMLSELSVLIKESLEFDYL